MGFLLDAIIEGLKMLVIVGIAYAVFNQPFQKIILPLIDSTTYPGISDFKTILMFVWNNWGTITIIGAVLYGIVAALRKTDTYGLS